MIMNDACKSSCCFCNEDALSVLDSANDKKYVSTRDITKCRFELPSYVYRIWAVLV